MWTPTLADRAHIAHEQLRVLDERIREHSRYGADHTDLELVVMLNAILGDRDDYLRLLELTTTLVEQDYERPVA